MFFDRSASVDVLLIHVKDRLRSPFTHFYSHWALCTIFVQIQKDILSMDSTDAPNTRIIGSYAILNYINQLAH